MKMSDADYRPKQRSRHVPSAPRRRIPYIRILILLVAAALVYKRFDSLWPGFHLGTRSASSSTRVKSGGKPVWIFSSDSTRAFLNCKKSSQAECCEALEGLHAGFCGEARAAVKKAAWLGQLNEPVLIRFEARNQTSGNLKTMELAEFEGRDRSGYFQYKRGRENQTWCDSTGTCLIPISPRLPLVQGKLAEASREQTGSQWTSPLPEVFPVLPGRIVGVDSLGQDRYRVTLYHGKELYTTYEPLQHLALGLKKGLEISSHKLLGAAAADSLALSSARYSLQFRVEQSGMPLDAIEFLAVEERKSNGP